MIKFFKKYITFLALAITLLNLSCGESPTNNQITNTGNITFQISGSITYNFDSKSVKIIEPDINTKYLTLYGSKNETNGARSLVVRLLIEDKDQKEYDISEDNSITFSINNGATSYKSLSGTLIISSWIKTTFKATFNATLEEIGNPQSIISIQNGTVEINTEE